MARLHAPGIPDWTDPCAYARLLQLERAGFAWKWLRRREDYAAAARRALGRGRVCERVEDKSAHAWNLHAFEDPDLGALEARPVWTAAAHPWVVRAIAEPALADEDALDLEQLGQFATLIRSSDADRLLFSDGYRSIRLDLRGIGIGGLPVRLTYEPAGIQSLARPLLVLRRFRALALHGRSRPSLHPSGGRAHRLVPAAAHP